VAGDAVDQAVKIVGFDAERSEAPDRLAGELLVGSVRVVSVSGGAR